ATVLREHGDAWAEQGASHRGDEGHAMHQLKHPRRVGLSGARSVAAQQRVAALGSTPGRKILGAPSLRRIVNPTAGKGRARVFSLEPVDHSFDTIDVGGGNAVLLT